jgi:signal transduction histidine kinase
MVADIAHELRTPLSLIQGSLEAILDGMYELNLDNVASVHEETLVLTRLVDDLRDLALAEAGQLRLDREEVDVADLIARSVERFRAQAAEQQVCLETELAPGLPPVHGDAQRLGQVLGNLLSNALRYTPPGGRIRIGVGVVSEEEWKAGRLEGWKIGRLEGRGKQAAPKPSNLPTFQSSNLPIFQPSNHPLLVTITDTGPGIPAEDVPYVFERFYRADKSRTRASGGSGLGLAIARQIVQAHGGRMGVDSQPGAGSTFFFTLPVSRP